MSYNRIERRIALFLASFPGIKNSLKRIYQFLNLILHKKNIKFRSKYPIRELSNSNKESFFGYYDKSPENEDGKYTVFQRTPIKSTQKPDPNNKLEFVIRNNITGKENTFDSSSAYNWQQGSRLQWLSENCIIYNIFDKEFRSLKSIIYDVSESRILNKIDFPIYDCYKKEYALSLSFSRLAKLSPDYGYRNIPIENSLLREDLDGIFLIDLKNNTRNLLISLNDLLAISPRSSMRDSKHSVNHIMISPDGRRFMFIHRWYVKGKKRYDRLLLSDRDGKSIKILADEEMISHCCWRNDEEIIGYLRQKDFGDTFYKININNSKTSLLSKSLLGLSDGHPSVYEDKMVFDTYPDRSRMKRLFLFDLKDEKLEEIGTFFEPIKYFGENRCDLHPRWNYSGTKIFLDSVHTGKRKLYVINLDT